MCGSDVSRTKGQFAYNRMAIASTARATASRTATRRPALSLRHANTMTSDMMPMPVSVTQSDVQCSAMLQDGLGCQRLQHRTGNDHAVRNTEAIAKNEAPKDLAANWIPLAMPSSCGKLNNPYKGTDCFSGAQPDLDPPADRIGSRTVVTTLWGASAGEPRQLAQARTNSDGRFELARQETPDADVILYVVPKGDNPQSIRVSATTRRWRCLRCWVTRLRPRS